MRDEAILICGGGVAGLAVAAGLARAGWRPELWGPRATLVAAGEPYHPRVYALSPASQSLLSELGAWDLMPAERIAPVRAMEVYGDGGGRLHLDAWQDAREALAWIVEGSELERALRQVLKVYGVIWHEDALERLEGGETIAASGRRWRADLIVGADGSRSRVREASGIAWRERPYGDTALVTHLSVEHPHQQTAVQWFTGDSVLALLPLPDSAAGPQVSMVWSMPGVRADAWRAMPADELNRLLAIQLHAVTGGRMGALTVCAPVHGFPLTLADSDMIAPGVALVGDAAHRVHPLAGQGLNLGLGDVRELLAVLKDKESFRRAGDLRVLRRYRRARAEPVLAMRWVTDGLHRLFASPLAPVAWARNAGLSGTDRLALLKRWLMSGAAGQ